MTSGSFFVQNPFVQTREAALRHVQQLAAGLKKVALAGMIGGVGCGVMAILLGRFLLVPNPQANAIPGFREISGITFVAAFMATALIVFSSLYFIAGWGLSHQKSWARYTATATFAAKVLLCIWLGRGSIGAMIVFLLVAAWDFYGLWVLLSKETGQLLTAPAKNQASNPNRPQPGAGIAEVNDVPRAPVA